MLLQIPIYIKHIEVLLMSMVKFFFSVPLALNIGFTYWQTIFTTTFGGVMGVLIFYYLSPAIMKILYYLYHGIRKLLGLEDLRHRHKKNKKKFTRRNKFIIKLRGKLGMFGIVAFTPVIFSIPFGSILANKYYGEHKFILPFLCLSVLAWSFILTTAFFFNYI